MDFDGKEIFNKKFDVLIEANGSCKYAAVNENDLLKDNDESKIIVTSQLKAGEKLLAENTYFFKDPKKLELEKPEIKVNAVKIDGGYEICLTSAKYAKDVYLSFDNTDGFFTDNYFDLLPGTEKKIVFQSGQTIDDFMGKLKIMSLVDSY
jgi:beta-mannosidase